VTDFFVRAFSWGDALATPVFVGLVAYFALIGMREKKIDRTGPTDDVIEDVKDRGGSQ
jgi:hypothetical protein